MVTTKAEESALFAAPALCVYGPHLLSPEPAATTARLLHRQLFLDLYLCACLGVDAHALAHSNPMTWRPLESRSSSVHSIRVASGFSSSLVHEYPQADGTKRPTKGGILLRRAGERGFPSLARCSLLIGYGYLPLHNCTNPDIGLALILRDQPYRCHWAGDDGLPCHLRSAGERGASQTHARASRDFRPPTSTSLILLSSPPNRCSSDLVGILGNPPV
ncbi:hypothetical protein K438DRAFT_1975385 [Mycena galopus ATCC 62051]|nr:hypothetical protein K438DRAFT_1975385 [Mycena galopus ATCC 62051]